MNLNVMTKEDVKVKAPAVFANQPASKMSEKYVFVPTHTILDQFENQGWYPVDAKQARTKKSDVAERQHIIRLANPEYTPVMPEVGSVTPQIILKNSHNGTSGIQLAIGLFRLVCSNGLIISSSEFNQVKRRHIGVNKDEILEVIHDATREFPDIFSKLNEYKSIPLNKKERIEFASTAIEYNWEKNSLISPNELLTPKRGEDEPDNLFNVFNVIQESIIKGGVTYINPRTERPRKTRSISNGNRDFNINCFLWSCMENFRKYRKFV